MKMWQKEAVYAQILVAAGLEDVFNSVIKTTAGTPYTNWYRLDVSKMAGSSTSIKNDCHATSPLDLHTTTTDNMAPTRLSLASYSLQCVHEGTRRSEQQWLKPDVYTYRRQTDLRGLFNLR